MVFYDLLSFKYNLNNNRIEYLHQRLKEDEWINDFKVLYQYENNHLISETRQDFKEDEWHNEQRITYSHNNEGLCTEANYENWIDDEWQNIISYIYQYDERRNKIRERTIRFTDIADTIRKKIWDYDNSDRIVRLRDNHFTNNVWDSTIIFEYSYHKSNFISKEEIKKQRQNHPTEYYQKEYVYDTHLRLLEFQSSVKVNNQWESISSEPVIYDEY